MTRRSLIWAMCLVVFFILFEFSFNKSYSEEPACGAYQPTHIANINLWVRNEVPSYSFKTGDWVLGEKIGVIKAGSKFQVKEEQIVGSTQVWLRICFELPDGRIVGGRGYWIWAGQVDVMNNIQSLTSNWVPASKETWSFSLVRRAYAQADDEPPSYMDTQIFPELISRTTDIPDDSAAILKDLKSWRQQKWSYFGLYACLLIGMVIGSTWDWLNLQESSGKQGSRSAFVRSPLKIVVGSLIAFSFFLGPIIGFGELGFTVSTAIIAFHFGLVHYDPSGLVNALRAKYEGK